MRCNGVIIELAMALSTQPHVPYIGYYGSVGILKAFCPDCRTTSFVIDKEFACCGTPIKHTPRLLKSKQESPPIGKRRQPTKKRKEEALTEQNQTCFYCGRDFGSPVWTRRAGLTTLVVEWDHVKPFAYVQDNPDDNFVAACQFCNRWKKSQVFTTIDEARKALNDKWQTKIKSGAVTV